MTIDVGRRHAMVRGDAYHKTPTAQRPRRAGKRTSWDATAEFTETAYPPGLVSPSDPTHRQVQSHVMTSTDRGGDHHRSRSRIPDEVIQAAREKFLRYGVNRTTMADVARDVGISRQAMYDYVSSRSDLVDAVLLQRIREIADELKSLSNDSVSFTEGFIEMSVAAIETARSDAELMNIVATGPNDRIQDVVTGPFPEVYEIVHNLLGPILQRGSRAGFLRTDKSQSEMIDWIRVVYLMMISQLSIESKDIRRVVSDFLLPSLMFSRHDTRADQQGSQDNSGGEFGSAR